MSEQAHYQTLLLDLQDGVLHLTLNRPEVRNAMSLTMVAELRALWARLNDWPEVRCVVLRGAAGQFCSGGDIKDMAQARGAGMEAYQKLNRAFGHLLQEAQSIPQVLICVLEGAVLGGGFGLACVSDLAIAAHNAHFGLPETSLGILPAQIAPFVVKRIGLTQARRLALSAARFDGAQALHLGLVHWSEPSPEALEERLSEQLEQIRRCAPRANAATKALLLSCVNEPLDQLLERAASQFAEAVASDEGSEGAIAFLQKRAPRWAQ